MSRAVIAKQAKDLFLELSNLFEQKFKLETRLKAIPAEISLVRNELNKREQLLLPNICMIKFPRDNKWNLYSRQNILIANDMYDWFEERDRPLKINYTWQIRDAVLSFNEKMQPIAKGIGPITQYTPSFLEVKLPDLIKSKYGQIMTGSLNLRNVILRAAPRTHHNILLPTNVALGLQELVAQHNTTSHWVVGRLVANDIQQEQKIDAAYKLLGEDKRR